MNKENIKIGFDLDGVILDNTTFKVEKYKEVYNIEFEDWQVSSNMIDEYVPDREMRRKIGNLAAARNFTKILDDKSIELFKKLNEEGYELYIVSRRGKSDEGQKAARESIKQQNLEKYFKEIFLCETENKKVETIINNGIQIFIDDRIEIIESLYKKIHLPLLFDNFELIEKDLLKTKYPVKKVSNFINIGREIDEYGKLYKKNRGSNTEESI